MIREESFLSAAIIQPILNIIAPGKGSGYISIKGKL